MCGSCIAKVTPYLDGSTEIKHWEVDTQNPNKVLTVETDNLSNEMVKDIVQQAGYKAEPINQ